MVDTLVRKVSKVNIRQDGLDVVLLSDGRRVLEVPWDAALQLGHAVIVQARRIEERLRAENIAFDQAILMRSGMPFGLTSNPMIIDMAKKEAAHNSLLRKNVPKAGGVESQEAVGAPKIIRHRRRDNGHQQHQQDEP